MSDKDWQGIAGDEPEVEVSHEAASEPEATGILEHPDYKTLEDKLTAAEMKAHENWDKATRAAAELKNFQERSARELEKAHKYAIENFVRDLLPIIDSMEQALQATGDHTEGVELTLKLFLQTLTKFGIEAIEPNGEAFDPQCHEAMSMQETTDVVPNTVLTVFQKGYQLNGRIVRPARVVVSKAPA